jgi:hypothetical protein
MRRRPLAFCCTLVGLGAIASVFAPATQAKPPEPLAACGQRGHVVFDKDTVLSDTSGRNLARFSGGESAVTLLAPPADGSDKARIETGTGKGSFRIRGFVKAAELPTFANASIPVVSRHVWIRPGTRVVAAGVSSGLDAGKVKIEKQVTTPFNQRFHALADCSSLTFTPPPPSAFSTPGNARVFLMKVALLDLYGDATPQARIIFTVQRSAQSESVRFFSNEQRGGFVHIQYGGEVGIDAWAKAADLQALPRGETSDVPSASYTLSSPPQLQLDKAPRIVQTKREVPLRISAREAEGPVGVIEAETDVYVMDTVAGWANVLPKSLHVLPAGNNSFWAKAADLGL